ncbi:virulence-associated E family protein [Paracoccus sp. IB05]|uniref:virulence-associated E family protein n=1 Tax=Paracoccus sp. IB05 TaxID=2779367 RepID=UPI0018E79473|nr:virulence-associated E family protein [Paracoccus sp. IB05]MBJ2153784.1 hypothetical protein [Paracoccus sp. IB05]
MTDLTLATFLPEYIGTVFGTDFPGVLVLWDKQTKKSRHFDAASVNKLIEAAVQDAPRLDLYIGNATQSADLAPGKRGGNATVAQVSAFFLDVDFTSEKNSSKNYPKDEEEALRILENLKHKPTLIQNSGGGLHVIFVLKEPIVCRTDADRKRAQGFLKAFQAEVAAHFKAHDREIDDCSDLARVYRVPLTFNHKYGEPRPVEVLNWDADARVDVADLKLAEVVTAGKSERKDYPPADHDLICKHCAWYEHLTGEGAASASEPDWTAGGSITAACLNGREIFLEYSATHPKYDQREAEHKFGHIEANVAPLRCDTISDRFGGEEFCKACKFWEKIKSPIQLGDEKRIALIEQRAIATEEGWPDQMKDGRPRASFRNAILCLLRLGVEILYDLFRLRISVSGVAVQEFAGDMNDDALAYLRKRATDAFGFDPGKVNIGDAAHTIALDNAYHPVQNYLGGLKWDGKPRLERLLTDYFGAEDTALNRAFAKAVFVAAVRRVRKPGTKFDTMLVLEGPQGSGKSSALRILAGVENFSDQNIIGLDQKVQGELLMGVWLYEVAELSGLKHTDTNDLKSFLSRDTDRFRAAYARFTTSHPRQCVFIGTTNDDTYLKDVTGNRRFWPVLTGEIDLKALERDRDQIWAEASELEKSDYSLTLPETLWKDAAEAQAKRMPRDPWLDQLEVIQELSVVNGEARVSTSTLFGPGNLNIAPGQRQDFHNKRLARVMGELGWSGPDTLRINGKAHRGYSRPAQPGTDEPPEF